MSVDGRFRLAIDIGHNPGEPGATSSRGQKEYFFNERIARELFEELKQNEKIHAFIVNEEGKNVELIDRTIWANKKNAHLFISLHHDSVQKQYLRKWNHNGREFFYCDIFSGYSIFVSKKNRFFPQSLEFAKLLGNQLRKESISPTMHHAERIPGENRKLLAKDLGIYEFDDLSVLKEAEMPAILLECGIIVNRDEELLLNSKSYRDKIVKSISNAISEYIERA